MLVKILGSMDIIIGIILIFEKNLNLSTKLLLIFGIILLLKCSLGLLKDFASWIDFLSGLVFILLIIISIPWFITFILGILLIQKGVFSFL